MTNLTFDDVKDLVHIVILKNETTLRVIEYTGPNAQEQAFAHSFSGFDGCVTVAVRIRQTCPASKSHLIVEGR